MEQILAGLRELQLGAGDEGGPPPVKVLDELSLSGIADHIKKIWSCDDSQCTCSTFSEHAYVVIM